MNRSKLACRSRVGFVLGCCRCRLGRNEAIVMNMPERQHELHRQREQRQPSTHASIRTEPVHHTRSRSPPRKSTSVPAPSVALSAGLGTTPVSFIIARMALQCNNIKSDWCRPSALVAGSSPIYVGSRRSRRHATASLRKSSISWTRYAAPWRQNVVAENVESQHRGRATIALRRRPVVPVRGRRRQAN